jgi:rRNA-processing protein FCF1
MKQKVIVDTSFLISAAKYRTDIAMALIPAIDGPFEVIAPSPVISELRLISRNRGKKGRDAAIGLELLMLTNPIIERTENKYADDAVIELSKKMPEAIVATNDVGMKGPLKRKGIRVFSIKGERFIGQV